MGTKPQTRSEAEIRLFRSFIRQSRENLDPKPQHSVSRSTSVIEAIGSFDDAEQPKLTGGIEEQQSGHAPNGGYGWVVVLGCFIIHVVFGGIERSEGIFYLEFKRKFGLSAQLTSLPGALVTALRLIVGPIAGALTYRFSVRLTCLLGSALLFVGMFLNAFIEDFILLFISHSILQGIGRGFLYTPSLIIVADYFDKKRGIANGLSTSGTGLGTFLMAPLLQLLFDDYGYTGAFMIISAISLHTAIPAILYKPLIARKDSVRDFLSLPEDTAILTYDSKSSGSSIRRWRDFDDQSSKRKTISPHKSDSLQRVRSPGVSLPDKVTVYKYDSESSVSSIQQLHQSGEECMINQSSAKKAESDITKIEEKRSFISMQKEKLKNKKEKLSDHLSANLLKNPPFVMFCFSITLFTAASKSTFTFMPALITSRGYSQYDASLTLSFTGAVDILGRIGAGLLFDTVQSRLVRPVIFNIFIGLLAIVTFILPLLTGYSAISLACAVNSMLTGAYVSQKTVISMDVLGPSNIPNSIGIFIFFQGFGVMLGVPLTGALGDQTDGYNPSFYLCGALMVGSGIFMSLSNIYIRNEEKENEAQ